MRVISYTRAALLTRRPDFDTTRDPKDADDPWKQADAAAEEAFEPLTSEQAEIIRRRHAALSPVRVVAWQTCAGLLATVVAWWWGGEVIGRSMMWGALVVVVPNALMAWRLSRHPSSAPAAAGMFLILEFAKVGMSVLMLVAGVWWIPSLNWLALLIAMVFCTKANWLALLWRPRSSTTTIVCKSNGN